MDVFMIDVSDIDVQLYDDVYIWDNNLLSLEDVAGSFIKLIFDFKQATGFKSSFS